MNKLEEIYNYYNNIFGEIADVYIIGGAVRDTLLGIKPRDYDIFLLNCKLPVDEFITHVKSLNLNFSDGHNIGNSTSYKTRYEDNLIEIIYYTNDKDIYSVLEHTDWNVSKFGYGFIPHLNKITYHKLMDESNIKEGGLLEFNPRSKIIPIRALYRGYKFQKRFKMVVAQEDIKLLKQQIFKYGI